MHSLKQQLLLLVIGPLIVLSVIGSVFSLAFMKDRAILATDNKAKSDLATGERVLELMYPGNWEVRNGVLYKGSTKIGNNFAAVDTIAKLTGDTVTIFMGDIRVSTTVREKDGERAIGTKASEAVTTAVLKNGQDYLGEANVVGELYRTAYKPIRDVNGKIVGMFYVGIAKNLSNHLIRDSLFSMAGISLVLTVLVALIAWYFAQKVIIKPLQEITLGTREMATGHLSGKVEVSSTNEIGELANAFNQMVEAMQSIAVRINKAAGSGTTGDLVMLNCIETADTKVVTNTQEAANIKKTAPNQTERDGVTGAPVSNGQRENAQGANELPKGLNEVTLKQLLSFLDSNDRMMTAEEIGEGVNITRVTARRYLDYLEKIALVTVEQKYGTVGRPVKLYKKV